MLAPHAHFAIGSALAAALIGPLLAWAGSALAGQACLALSPFIAATAALWLWRPRALAHRFEKALGRFGPITALNADVRLPTWLALFAGYTGLSLAQAATLAPLAYDLVGPPDGSQWLTWLAVCAAYPVARLLGQMGVAFPGGLGAREGA